MQRVHLITCTGDRPEAFALCCRYVERWRTRLPLRWIVVDDGNVPSPCPPWADYFHCFRVNVAGHTLARNLLVALEHLEACENDALFFIEDDDFYGVDYLERMLAQLDRGFLAVGQCRARYYNIEHLRFRVLENSARASLAQTAFRCALPLTLFARIVARDNARTDIDVQFWQEASARALNTFLFPETFSFVGMKGLPGRKGIGIGHRPSAHWSSDAPKLDTLKEWIGDANDFNFYWRMIRAAQPDLFHHAAR